MRAPVSGLFRFAWWPGRRRRGLWLPLLSGLVAAGCGPTPEGLGERIFQTGMGSEGRVPYVQGPRWLAAARGGCAVCHGRAGQGLNMQAGQASGAAPPLTADYLAVRGYDPESLARAITRGVDPSGRAFGYYMPRWQIGEDEMNALLAYLARL